MNIAIDYYPLLKFYHSGPKVFLNRLKNSLRKQNLCNIKSPLLPFYDIALYSVYEKNIFNKNFVLRVDGIYFDNKNTAGNSDVLNNQIFESIKKSKGVIYISEFSKKMVHKFCGNFDLPETVIHNSVPLDLFNPKGNNYREYLNFNANDRILITSAHWRTHKRLKETIKLVNFLNEKGSKNYRYKLIVLGKNKKTVSNENVIYAGEISPSKLSDWYRTADIYIHLAWIEPCGNTQIEAMASGLPVICCNNGGIGETVKNAHGGIVVDCDQKYVMNKIDYYNPPEPNYEKLISAVNKIFDNYLFYKNQINYDYLNIDISAQKYFEFIQKCNLLKK